MKSSRGGFFRVHEAQVQLAAALDDLLEQLVDRVLVAVGEAGHGGAHLAPDLADEARGRLVLRVGRRRGEQVVQVAVVEVRVIEPVVLALLPVVLAQRLAQPRQRIDQRAWTARPAGGAPARASGDPCTRACAGPASPRTASPSATADRARRRTSRRSPRPDGSARTSDPGAGRSSCCRASACSTRGRASPGCRTAAACVGRRRSSYALSIAWPTSWRRIFRHVGASPPSTSSICASSSFSSRGCAR